MSRVGAREKMSQKEAEYQDSPKDIRMCATCTLFEPPKSSKVVEGEISPNGWCKVSRLQTDLKAKQIHQATKARQFVPATTARKQSTLRTATAVTSFLVGRW
jgi:hypothetical protein